MTEYRYEIHVAAPPDQVFALWTNLERMHEWVGGVTDVTDITGSIDRAGTRYTVWFGRMGSPTEVLEVERPHLFRTRFGNTVLRGEMATTLVPEGDGTRLTEVLRTRGFISALAARVFATGSWRGSFRGELEAFRTIAVREARASVQEPSGAQGSSGRTATVHPDARS